MQIAITGASGFVARQLIPRLKDRGAKLLLIGRQPAELRRQYPGCDAADYAEIESRASGFDLLLHLAVINNDKDAEWEQIERANVELPVQTCLQARGAGIRAFAFVSSTLALETGNTTPYAASKRLAEQRLDEVQGIARTILYLPAVSGDSTAGKLAILNRLPASLRRLALRLLGALKPTVHVDRIADAVAALARNGDTEPPRSIIISDGQQNNPFFRIGKRLFDLAFALAVVLLLWWAMVLIWALVRLLSPGPGIFRQRRVGKNEREFTCYKFRTMLISTPQVGTHDAPVASVTPFGGFLRKTKLDELPQVLNIFANQMSLVGPRPCLPVQTALIEARRARGVYEIVPGITGLAQINGIDMSDPERLAECDERYVRIQSLLLDLKITIRTFMGGGSGDRIRAESVPAPGGSEANLPH